MALPRPAAAGGGLQIMKFINIRKKTKTKLEKKNCYFLGQN